MFNIFDHFRFLGKCIYCSGVNKHSGLYFNT